jgi:pimeloyl-ACP methyl ester carboxylesterase
MRFVFAILLPLFLACATVPGTEHRIARDRLELSLWEKDGTRSPGARRVVVLVHGATWSGRPDFDLPLRDYSLMDALARAGLDALSLDIHGYGRSSPAVAADDWSDTRSAVKDLEAAVDWIVRERGVPRVALLGWSWGTQIAGLYAEEHPERLSKLVLYAPLWNGPPRLASLKAPLPTAPARENTDEDARSDFIPELTESRVMDLYASEALKSDPRSPNGVLVDLRSKLPLLDPGRIRTPTLVIQGEKDPISTKDDISPFVARLGTAERRHVILPKGGHAVMLEKEGHALFQRAVLDFLN